MYKIGIIGLLIFNTATAQELSFKWSKKLPSKAVVNYCGAAGNAIFATQIQDSKTILLHSFDNSLLLKQQDTLILAEKNQQYLTSFSADSQLVHVIVQNENRKQTNILFIKSSFQHPEQPSTAVAAQLKDGYMGIVYAYYSQDRSKLLLTNFSFKAATQTTIRDFIVINTAKGNVQFSGTVSYEGSSQQIGVANNGTAWFSALQVYSWKKRIAEKPKTQQKIILIKPDNTEKELTIRFENKYSPSVDILEDNNNTLYFTGFAYENDAKVNRLSASEWYIYKVDAENGLVTDSAFTSFTGLYPENKLKEEDRLPYTIKQLYKRNDGGYTILAEQYQIISGQYSTSQKYNDIACIQLQKDFRFEAAVRIPKLQYGTDNPSFISSFINDTVYIIYNDLTENLYADGDKLSYPSNKQNKNGLFLIRIDNKLTYNKQLLYDYASGEPMPQLLSSFSQNNQTVLLPAEAQIGILTIKK